MTSFSFVAGNGALGLAGGSPNRSADRQGSLAGIAGALEGGNASGDQPEIPEGFVSGGKGSVRTPDSTLVSDLERA